MAILEQASVLTDAIRPVPTKELEQRLEKFRKLMDARHPDWEMAVISHKVAMYYFTGTMQEGALIITPADAVLWVRRNFVRASISLWGKRLSGWRPSVRVVLSARGLTVREVRMGPASRCSPSGMRSAI